MKNKMKRFLSILLSLTLVLGLLPGMSLTAFADNVTVYYLDANGNMQTCADYTNVTSNYNGFENNKWYFVSGSEPVVIPANFNVTLVNTNVNLILCDGAELQFSYINNMAGGSLTIFAGSTGENIKGNGKMTLTGNNWNRTVESGGGTLTLNGGVVSLSSASYGTFGNGGSGGGGSLVINGGSLTAQSTGNAAAIDSDVTLTVNNSGVIKAGANEANAEEKQNVEGIAGNSDIKYVSISYAPPHTHIFGTSYALSSVNATNDTITATCNDTENCTLTDGKATMTIVSKSDGKATLKGNASDFGVTDANIVYKKDGSVIDATAITDTGFYEASITVKDSEEHTYTASITYGVNCITYAQSLEHGTVRGDTTATVGATITPTIVPETGYELKALTVKQGDSEVALNSDKKSFNMPGANVTVSAEFQKIHSDITITQPVGGTISSDKTSADYGDIVTLSNTPVTGFKFVSYKVTKTGDENTTIDASSGSFSMPAYPVTISATFEGTPFAVATVSDPTIGGSVMISGTGVNTQNDPTTAKAGSEVTVNVRPDVGFEVDTVKYNNTAITAEGGVYKFTMPTEAVTVTATFVGKNVSATLGVEGNSGTACKASLLDSTYKAVDSVTKKAGEKFILSVSTDEDYDYTVAFDPTQSGDLKDYIKEFTNEDYKEYIDYIKANKISVPSQTDLFWVTMPGVAGSDLNIKVTFAKPGTFTVLYRPTNGSPGEVWCKFTKTVNSADTNYAVEMKKDAVMGNTAVWSVKVTAAFNPTKIAFATSENDIGSATLEDATVSQTADWKSINGGEYLIVGGKAKTVIAAFVTDASALSDYNSDTATFNIGQGSGVIYQIAVCGTDGNGTVTNAGTVTAPSTPAKEGYTFAGWRGFKGSAPDKTEELYAASAVISIEENTTFHAVWEQRNLSITLDKNGGTGGTDVSSVQYGQKLVVPENPAKSGFVFDGWVVKKAVTENGVSFAKGSSFDMDTPITENLELKAQWKHVHSFTCVPLDYSGFGDALAEYYEYLPYIHVQFCGCAKVKLEAHTFNEGGVCTGCGYTKPDATEVKLEVSYWKNGSEWMKEPDRTAKIDTEVSVSAFYRSGDYEFSKWEYSTDSGTTWHDLAATTMVGFIIPCSMKVRAVYASTVTNPQISLRASRYKNAGSVVYNGETLQLASILYHMDYKLPDGYSFVDAGVRLGDNEGISYYELKERKRTAGEKAAWGLANFTTSFITGNLGDAIYDGVRASSSLESNFYYEKRENSVLEEISAKTLSDYMYQFKPVNAEKYPPVYWESKAETKGQSGSLNVLAPVAFARKNDGKHYIYGMAYLRYKDRDGKIQTIYTDALPATLDSIPTDTVTESGS